MYQNMNLLKLFKRSPSTNTALTIYGITLITMIGAALFNRYIPKWAPEIDTSFFGILLISQLLSIVVIGLLTFNKINMSYQGHLHRRVKRVDPHLPGILAALAGLSVAALMLMVTAQLIQAAAN